jgi:hypothetical protein
MEPDESDHNKQLITLNGSLFEKVGSENTKWLVLRMQNSFLENSDFKDEIMYRTCVRL